jgi:hypothetical protein
MPSSRIAAGKERRPSVTMARGRPWRFNAFFRNFKTRCFIALFRQKGFEDLALVINRTPQIMPLAVDPDEHLIEVPAPVMKPTHPIHPLAPDISCEQRPEAVPSQPHRLVANVDTPFEQHILDIAQRQRKPNVSHNDQPNHLR